MKDFHETPAVIKSDSSLFLVKNPANLTAQILDQLHQALLKDNAIISLEKLFKGSQKATVIFGSKSLLDPFTDILGLLELEDYTNIDKFTAWEVTSKDSVASYTQIPNISKHVPFLKNTEQVWWQLTVQPGQQKVFEAQARFVVVADEKRQKEIARELENIENKLIKIPRPFTSNQILSSYKARAKGISGANLMLLTSDEIIGFA